MRPGGWAGQSNKDNKGNKGNKNTVTMGPVEGRAVV